MPTAVEKRVEQAINHCGMSNIIEQKQMSKEDVMEAVLDRAGIIVDRTVKGEGRGTAHAIVGIELMATAVANQIIEKGAEKLASDFSIKLTELKEHATSRHISSC